MNTIIAAEARTAGHQVIPAGIDTEQGATAAAEAQVADWLERHFTSTQLGYQHGHSAEDFAEGIIEDIMCALDAEGRFEGVDATSREWQAVALDLLARSGVVLADFARCPEPCELRALPGCADPDTAARELAAWDVD